MLQPIPPETLAAIRAMIAGGNKIEAIKLLREATGLDLMRSKEAVEKLEAGVDPAVFLSRSPSPEPELHLTFPAVRAALAAGHTIEAIKLYREATGCGLAEAKSAVDQMAKESHDLPASSFPLPPPGALPSNTAASSGCIGLLFATATSLTGATLWLLS